VVNNNRPAKVAERKRIRFIVLSIASKESRDEH
jgi:hypothetical protein